MHPYVPTKRNTMKLNLQNSLRTGIALLLASIPTIGSASAQDLIDVKSGTAPGNPAGWKKFSFRAAKGSQVIGFQAWVDGNDIVDFRARFSTHIRSTTYFSPWVTGTRRGKQRTWSIPEGDHLKELKMRSYSTVAGNYLTKVTFITEAGLRKQIGSSSASNDSFKRSKSGYEIVGFHGGVKSGKITGFGAFYRKKGCYYTDLTEATPFGDETVSDYPSGEHLRGLRVYTEHSGKPVGIRLWRRNWRGESTGKIDHMARRTNYSDELWIGVHDYIDQVTVYYTSRVTGLRIRLASGTSRLFGSSVGQSEVHRPKGSGELVGFIIKDYIVGFTALAPIWRVHSGQVTDIDSLCTGGPTLSYDSSSPPRVCTNDQRSASFRLGVEAQGQIMVFGTSIVDLGYCKCVDLDSGVMMSISESDGMDFELPRDSSLVGQQFYFQTLVARAGGTLLGEYDLSNIIGISAGFKF